MQAETCLQKSQSNMGVIKNEEDEVPLDQEGMGSSDTVVSSAEEAANDETKSTSNEVDITSNKGMINDTTSSSSWQEETNVETRTTQQRLINLRPHHLWMGTK